MRIILFFSISLIVLLVEQRAVHQDQRPFFESNSDGIGNSSRFGIRTVPFFYLRVTSFQDHSGHGKIPSVCGRQAAVLLHLHIRVRIWSHLTSGLCARCIGLVPNLATTSAKCVNLRHLFIGATWLCIRSPTGSALAPDRTADHFQDRCTHIQLSPEVGSSVSVWPSSWISATSNVEIRWWGDPWGTKN